MRSLLNWGFYPISIAIFILSYFGKFVSWELCSIVFFTHFPLQSLLIKSKQRYQIINKNNPFLKSNNFKKQRCSPSFLPTYPKWICRSQMIMEYVLSMLVHGLLRSPWLVTSLKCLEVAYRVLLGQFGLVYVHCFLK